MAKPVAVNTSSLVPSGSLQKGKISYVVQEQQGANYAGGYSNKNWYSSIPTDGDRYVIVSSSNDIPRFWTTPSTSSADVLLIVNGLPDRYNKTPFTSIDRAFSYLLGSDQYFVYGGGFENLDVTDVAAYFDAAQIGSYPTTGSTWYSITPINTTGSLCQPDYNPSGLNFSQRGPVVTINSIQGSGSSTSIIFSVKNKTTVSTLGVDYNYTSSATSNVSIANTKYSNIAAVFDANLLNNTLNRKVYLNGELKINSTITVESQSAIFPINLSLNNNNVLGTSSIQNAVVYNRAIDQTEVNQMYYGGNIITDGLTFASDAGNVVSFYSGSSLTYSLTGSLSGSLLNGVIYKPTNGGVWDFDGADDWIQIPTYTFGNGSWTVNAWVNADSLSNYNILSNSSGGPVTNAFGIEASKIFYRNYNGVWQNNSGTTNLSLGKWFMLTWVNYAGASANLGTMQMFVNGKSDSSIFNSYTTNGGPCDAIGRNWFSYFNGRIGTIQFYNKSLSLTEIGQNFNAQRNRFNI